MRQRPKKVPRSTEQPNQSPMGLSTAKRGAQLQKHVKKTISVAGVFKRSKAAQVDRASTNESRDVRQRRPINNLKRSKHDLVAQESMPSNPIDIGVMDTANSRPTLHPLAVEFNGATSAYRNNLYERAEAAINGTHTKLLAQLDASVMHSDTEDVKPEQSPTRLQIWTKLQNVTRDLYTPLHTAELTLTVMDEKGENKKITRMLGQRMADFQRMVYEEAVLINNLMTQWEATIGEICELGVQALGENDMQTMLVPRIQPEMQSLFVPESRVRDGRGEKQVSFGDPFLRKLAQPSAFKHPVIPILDMASGKVNELERQIDEVGAMQMEELKKLKKEQVKIWQRKQQQVADVFQHDE